MSLAGNILKSISENQEQVYGGFLMEKGFKLAVPTGTNATEYTRGTDKVEFTDKSVYLYNGTAFKDMAELEKLVK